MHYGELRDVFCGFERCNKNHKNETRNRNPGNVGSVCSTDDFLCRNYYRCKITTNPGTTTDFVKDGFQEIPLCTLWTPVGT